MFGSGLLKGLGVTIKHFIDTYVDDVKKIPSRYAHGEDFLRQTPDERGIFTIQYPEEKRQLPERFRYIPMLIHDTPKGEDRCTACGICAKVCPPQCIWIVRDKDEKGKPIPRPAEFYIDASICMSCGFCAEFCPFDAIKMNHDYEIAAYERMPELVFDLEELRVPTTYYARIRPGDWEEEEAARKAKEAEKAAAKAAPAAEKAPPAGAPAAPAAATAAPAAAAAEAAAAAAGAAAVGAAAAAQRTPEEVERLKAEAAARRAAKAAGEAAPPAAEASSAAATPGVGAQRTPEEIERLKAEAAARRAAKAAGETPAATTAAAPGPVAPEAEAPPAAAPAATPGVGAQRTP